MDHALARRHLLLAGLAAAGWGGAGALPLDARRARLTADFEPAAAVWLGYDAGHEAFTAELARALHPHVPLKLLVRDDESEAAARALLALHGVPAERVQWLQHPAAMFFVRDALVFGLAPDGGLGVVDFRWTHYGWPAWCRGRRGLANCGVVDPGPAATLDRELAAQLGAAVFTSALAMEGGGVESNGQGLLIANEALWTSRNPQLPRSAIERELRRLPGVRQVVWLPAGLAQDPLHRGRVVGRYVAWGTGGHTDEFVRFADPRTVLLAWPDEAEAARHPVARLNLQRMRRNLEILQAVRDPQGRPLTVLKLPLPRVVERPVRLAADADPTWSRGWSASLLPPGAGWRDGDEVIQVAAASTLNFVVANGVVLVPDYRRHGTPERQHRQVLEVLGRAFPGRQLVEVDAIGANWVGAGAHCATLNEPRVG